MFLGLLGTYRHNLDKKGRLIMPQKLREDLGDQFVVTLGVEKCLLAYSAGEWEKQTEKLNQLSMAKGRQLKRHFFSNASVAETDSMGRILIPAYMREKAELEKEVVIIGSGDHVEIWSDALWNDESGEFGYEQIQKALEDAEL